MVARRPSVLSGGDLIDPFNPRGVGWALWAIRHHQRHQTGLSRSIYTALMTVPRTVLPFTAIAKGQPQERHHRRGGRLPDISFRYTSALEA